jgi:hypothetical protein
MALLSRRRVFTVWSSLAIPLLVGAVISAFCESIYLGIFAVAVSTAWLWHLGATTCSRCACYDNWGCGVQAKVFPFIWKHGPPTSVPTWRVRLHRYFDLLMIALGIVAYAPHRWLLGFVLVWAAVGWWVALGPKRFHGLLFRLKAPAEEPTPGRVSLPLVAVPPSAGLVEVAGGPPAPGTHHEAEPGGCCAVGR